MSDGREERKRREGEKRGREEREMGEGDEREADEREGHQSRGDDDGRVRDEQQLGTSLEGWIWLMEEEEPLMVVCLCSDGLCGIKHLFSPSKLHILQKPDQSSKSWLKEKLFPASDLSDI